MIFLLSFWPLFGALIGIRAANRRGFHVAAGIIGGLLLGPLAFLMYFARQEGRQCPSCAEWVKNEARTCKHCHAALPPPLPTWNADQQQSYEWNWITVLTAIIAIAIVMILVRDAIMSRL